MARADTNKLTILRVNKLQHQFGTVLPWLRDWKLSLNTNKIAAVSFGRMLKHINLLKTKGTDNPGVPKQNTWEYT